MRFQAGSPPLAREQLLLEIHAILSIRITPARAGTTRLGVINIEGKEDHPRSRGNNRIVGATEHALLGSPPLAREQPIIHQKLFPAGGITPARAGTTSRTIVGMSFSQDHPRSRGNNKSELTKLGRKLGSPPLAREQQITITSGKS